MNGTEKVRAVVQSKEGFLEVELPFELGLEIVCRVWTGHKVGVFIH